MLAESTDTFTCKTRRISSVRKVLTKSTYRFRLPGYICVESKANLIKGGKGLLLAARNKSGLQISELQSCQAWLSGIIYGGKINGKKFESIVTNVHIPSTVIRRLKASNEIFSLINKAKLKFKKNIILDDFNMDIKGANKISQKLGASYSRAKVTNSTGSRWNKNKIGRMIDHIFYAGFTSRENWCTSSKKIYMSDHMPIMAQWSIDALKDTVKKTKIDAKKVKLIGCQLICSNRFDALYSEN
ncbi:hypothetical protein AYI70_g7348 [Smittium culicis]|uniref:Endonuclease/exonuclease/phosphatase domain-containing protein n=1 Tax=Smittium culicis TaxID=133412 RepID=A0A1R1XL02_9FUNG|nr:hypothetical protein AYI70_g7348 [Smittium culicis]